MAGNERTNVKIYPTASSTDVLFYVLVDSTLPKNKLPVYGTSYRTCLPHAAEDFPDHELVFIAADDGSGKQKWYFAAKRASQDIYNWEMMEGEQLIRTYVIKRSLFRGNPEGFAPALADEFLHPPAGAASPDTLLAHYCFADDTVVKANQELDSLYVVVRRRFIRPVTVDFPYSEEFKRNISVTKEIIPRTTSAPAAVSAGSSVEIQDGNHYHSVRITKSIVLGEGETYPYALPSVPSTQKFNFPSRLDSVDIIGSWGHGTHADHRPSYSEDFYFEFKITDPRPGPYSATVRRWVTDDPEAIQALHPRAAIPQPIREAVGIVSAWAYGSAEHGNASSATAKEVSIPPTIHGLIMITIGGKPTPPGTALSTTSLPATPGVDAFLALTATNLPAITGYTGGGATNLDGQNLDGITAGRLFTFIPSAAPTTLETYEVEVSAVATSSPTVIRSADWATSGKVYRRLNPIEITSPAEAETKATVHYEAREMGLGLYEVSVVDIDTTGLYA